MKKLSATLFLMLVFTSTSLFAGFNVLVTPPTVNTGNTGNDAAINTALNNAKSTFETQLQSSDLSMLGSQDMLAKGFGNSVVYASGAASLDGYQGYDLFAILFGASISAQLPDSSLSLNTVDHIKNDIIRDKDLDAGVGFSSAFNIGLNITVLKNIAGLGGVLPNRLYANIKYFSLSRDIKDYSLDTSIIGLGLNYQLIEKVGIPLGLVKWSGISIGTGFFHTTSKVDFTFKFDEYISNPINVSSTNYYMGFTPDTHFGVDISENIIPIDLSTSLKVLWILNISAGLGIDLTFGKSDIVTGSTTGMKVYSGPDKNNLTPVALSTGGIAVVDAGTKGKPTFANFRVSGGIGICMGPVPIDLRMTTYPFTSGYSVSLSTGIVW